MNFEMKSTQMEVELLRHLSSDLTSEPMAWLDNVVSSLDLSEPMNQEIHGYIEEENVEDIIYRAVAKILLTGRMSSQALIGMFYKNIKKYTHYHTIANLLLNAIAESSLVRITHKRAYIYFDAAVKLPKDVAEQHSDLVYVMPSTTPPLIIEDNHSIGYRHIKESVICGGSLKHHNKPLNLTHINRLNATPYRFETRVPFLVQPKFNAEPKMKDSGVMETEQDVAKRFKSFTSIVDQLPKVSKIMVSQGNKFYIHHKFDNGGRTYAKAHHCNYQGLPYCKALIQSYTKVLIEPEF